MFLLSAGVSAATLAPNVAALAIKHWATILAVTTTKRIGSAEWAFWLMLLAALLPLSVWLLGAYTGGDQVPYTRFYDAISELSLFQAIKDQPLHISGSEPLFATLMWLGAVLGVPKGLYISMLNVIFIGLLIATLRRYRVSIPIVLLALTNFYVLVLLTGAERLKISYIFLFAAILSTGAAKWVFLAAAPAAHFQTLLNYAALAARKAASFAVNFDISRPYKKNSIILLAILAIIATVTFSFFSDKIVEKANIYMASNVFQWSSFVNSGALICLGLFLSNQKLHFASMMLPLLGAIALIGADRVNMIVFVMFFYALMLEGRASHPLVYVPMIYLSYKSVGFIASILQYGNGFASQ